MVVVMVCDICVLVIKLVDWLYNVCIWCYVSVEFVQCKVREIFEIYVLLVYWLGMNIIKWEFEDFLFVMLYFKVYDEIVRLVSERVLVCEEYFVKVCEQVMVDLCSVKFKVIVIG